MNDFLTQVVHLYYQRGMNQTEIAECLGVSKMTISRTLSKALETGLVEFRVNLPVQNDTHLERELKEHLKFNEVFVARLPGSSFNDSEDPEEHVRRWLGKSTAMFVSPFLHDDMVLGVALGKTVGELAEQLPHRTLSEAKVVQLLGGLGKSAVYNPYNLVQLVSERLGAKGFYFSGPAFVSDPRLCEAILNESINSGLQELWKQCDLCLVGLGSCSRSTPWVTSGLITEDELKGIIERGGVGDILGRYYDLQGNFVSKELDNRVNAIPLTDLKTVKRLVVTAGGPSKVKPIIGASRTGLPITLVTDENTARAIMSELE